MSKNDKYYFQTLAMSNDINVGEGWEGGVYEYSISSILLLIFKFLLFKQVVELTVSGFLLTLIYLFMSQISHTFDCCLQFRCDSSG
jgi:hypothetical protein